VVKFIRSDLDFILQQILIAEQNAAGVSMLDLLPNVQVPWGLRTVTGALNNLVLGQSAFGAADTLFPRLTDAAYLPAYTPENPFVVDPQPRIISNLIVDQTNNNPAVTAAAAANDGSTMVTSPGLDGLFSTPADNVAVNFLPNVTPDFGLTAPFNSWMTFFGQFFDHGLDLVTKSSSEVVFIPLKPDDPLYVEGSPTNFMVLSRATTVRQAGADGILGNADDTYETQNTTSPFVDQNQTYTSHPSHQVFLREYMFDAAGHPVTTGRLITDRDLGADGKFGTADDTDRGGNGHLEGREGPGARHARDQPDGRGCWGSAAARHRRLWQLHPRRARPSSGRHERPRWPCRYLGRRSRRGQPACPDRPRERGSHRSPVPD
jgi:hypothetical protein